jgi:hypothetical protein
LPLPSPSRVLTTVLGERAGPENSKPMATGHTLGPTLEPHPPSRTGPPGPSSLSRPSIRIARRDATTSVSGTSTAAVTTVPLGYPGMVVPGSGPAPPTAPCGRSGWCGPAWPWEAVYGGSARSAARPALVSRAGTTPCERPVGARQQPSGHEHASPGLVAEPPVVDAQVRHRGVHDLTASGVDRVSSARSRRVRVRVDRAWPLFRVERTSPSAMRLRPRAVILVAGSLQRRAPARRVPLFDGAGQRCSGSRGPPRCIDDADLIRSNGWSGSSDRVRPAHPGAGNRCA